MNHFRSITRFGAPTLFASVSAALIGIALGSNPTQAAVVEGGKGPQLLIGRDDDRKDNAAIQAGAVANQSLNRTDVLEGGPGNDVMFGLNGNDVMDGGPGTTSSWAAPTADQRLAVLRTATSCSAGPATT